MTDTASAMQLLNRRSLLSRGSVGLGSAALASMLQSQTRGSTLADPASRLSNKQTGENRPHHPCKAKSVIFVHLVGAPSHLDLFDYKPVLQRLDGQLMPDDLWKGLRLAFIRKQPALLGTRFRFRQHGDSGLELSELLPSLGQMADELCVIKSLHTEHFNHAPAQLFLQSGFGQFGRPSMGAWVHYGLGSENRNLPGFVVLITGDIAGAGNSLWGSGFLPSVHQGVEFRSSGDPVLFLSNPDGLSTDARKRIIDEITQLNSIQLADVGDPEIATRIQQYELAWRMQSAVPELMSIDHEPEHIHRMYGTAPGKPSFANNCLLARRLVERGVRFVQLYDEGWDHHSGVFGGLRAKCKQVDQPLAALLLDLKQRGLLEETLVVWGSEFGRTPMLQDGENSGRESDRVGRDHHKEAFAVWMAGGGIKPGTVYGKTDEIGFHIVENPMHVNDFHATILHLLGIQHDELTFQFQGRPYRLTDIGGKVIAPIVG
ncbi:MAG: DUF1501 domain-containing protein [Planctomyces sp.]|nr:DUF1501 domain-containing protein [Planctomyces sp.]